MSDPQKPHNGLSLDDHIEIINQWPGRPSARPIIVKGRCRYCGHEFPVQPQDHGLWKNKNVGFVCSGSDCRSALTDDHNRAQKARRKSKK